ncbi:MAG: hypothetical protein SFW35_08735 [Chitinophagales bacterium]|nr:hypothetical protein [Chitinophagales bacterium]
MDFDRFTDLRFVIGLFFAILGLLLVIVGFVYTPTMAAHLLNACSGAVMLVLGLFMLWLSYKRPL